jgi:hypothetical protein
MKNIYKKQNTNLLLNAVISEISSYEGFFNDIKLTFGSNLDGKGKLY